MSRPQPRMKASQLELIDLLREVGGMTIAEVQIHFGITDTSAWKRISRLHSRGLVRIARYVRTTGAPGAVFVVADGQPDAPWPGGVGHKARQKAYRKRHEVRIAVRRYGNRTRLAQPFGQLMKGN